MVDPTGSTPSPRPAYERVPHPASASTFVTVLAWFAIAGSALMSVISIMQVVMVVAFFPKDFGATLGNAPFLQGMPEPARFLFTHPHYMAVVFWGVSALTLVAAIGLLRRRNWARIYFIALLVASIVSQLLGLWLQRHLEAALSASLDGLPPDLASELGAFHPLLEIAMIALFVGHCVLFGWLIYRLMSPSVKAEFGVRPR